VAFATLPNFSLTSCCSSTVAPNLAMSRLACVQLVPTKSIWMSKPALPSAAPLM